MSEFNEADVLSLWRCARAHNSSIPDEALDAMRGTLLATLRQQGGRSDVMDEAVLALDAYLWRKHGVCLGKAAMRAALEAVWPKAALAQNTQGESQLAGYVDPVQVADMKQNGGAVQIGSFSTRYGRTVPVYYTHAERATVPDVPEGAVATRDHFGAPCVAIVFDSHENADKYRAGLNEAMQLHRSAATPSRRANFRPTCFVEHMGHQFPIFERATVPTVCDGKEQDAFEAWAKGEGYDMSCHPLHWLFLNERTYTARQGWKGALEYVTSQLAAAPSQPEDAQS